MYVWISVHCNYIGEANVISREEVLLIPMKGCYFLIWDCNVWKESSRHGVSNLGVHMHSTDKVLWRGNGHLSWRLIFPANVIGLRIIVEHISGPVFKVVSRKVELSRGIYPRWGWGPPTCWGPILNTMEKMSWGPAFISLCFPTSCLKLLPACLPSMMDYTLELWTERNPSAFNLLLGSFSSQWWAK